MLYMVLYSIAYTSILCQLYLQSLKCGGEIGEKGAGGGGEGVEVRRSNKLYCEYTLALLSAGIVHSEWKCRFITNK